MIKNDQIYLRTQISLECAVEFHATGLFLCPLKKSENYRFSDCFHGLEKETSGMK